MLTKLKKIQKLIELFSIKAAICFSKLYPKKIKFMKSESLWSWSTISASELGLILRSKKCSTFFKDRKIGFPKHSNYVVENYVDFFALKVGWVKLKQIGWTCVRFLWLKYSMIQSWPTKCCRYNKGKERLILPSNRLISWIRCDQNTMLQR